MIDYLIVHKANFDRPNFIRHQRVVKLVLKQQKIFLDYRKLAIRLVGSVHEQEAFYREYDMLESLVELYEEQKFISKLLELRVELGHFEKALNLASSMPCCGESVIGNSQLSELTSIVWIDRIISSPSSSFIATTRSEIDQSWRLAYKILRTWDLSTSEKAILAMKNDLVVRDYLCLYITIHMEQIVKLRRLSDIPYGLFCHALIMIRGQAIGPSGTFGAAVLLLCGVHRDFSSSQQYITRPWSPLRDIFGSAENKASLPEAALRWTYNKLSSAILRANELTRELFRVKWPSRCSFFLAAGFCKFRSKAPYCPYQHELVTGPAPSELLHDVLTINRFICQTTTLYNRRLMPEDISQTFTGTRRYWLERLIAALSFVSAFEQDSTALKECRHRLRTEGSFRAVAAGLCDLLFYKVRTNWGTLANLGFVFEQLDIAAYLGETVTRSLISTTSASLRHQDPSTFASLVLLNQLQIKIMSGDAIGFLQSLRDYLEGPRGIMKLRWNAFEIFHCHTSRFEEIAFYLLLQITRSSIMVPRSWVDLHLPDILKKNDLANSLDFKELSIYRDALIILLTAFVELLYFVDASIQQTKKFQLCGREYPSRILQQRNCEFLLIIMVNLLAVRTLCPPDMKTRWESVVRMFELPTVKASHLNHKVGNEIEMRNRLLDSHRRYQGKNPLVIFNIVDGISQHPFTAFQKTNGLATENLGTLRKAASSRKNSSLETPAGAATEASSEQAVAGIKAAQCVWSFWQKYSPRLKARRAFANTIHGRLISKLDSLSKSCSLKMRCILFSYGPEVFPLLDSLDSSISVLKKRTLLQVDTAGVELSEALHIVLEAATQLGEALKLHHESLSDESLHVLIQTEDGDRIIGFLKAEQASMVQENGNVATQNEILDGMVEKQARC